MGRKTVERGVKRDRKPILRSTSETEDATQPSHNGQGVTASLPLPTHPPPQHLPTPQTILQSLNIGTNEPPLATPSDIARNSYPTNNNGGNQKSPPTHKSQTRAIILAKRQHTLSDFFFNTPRFSPYPRGESRDSRTTASPSPNSSIPTGTTAPSNNMNMLPHQTTPSYLPALPTDASHNIQQVTHHQTAVSMDVSANGWGPLSLRLHH
jgi:hypothetical protein